MEQKNLRDVLEKHINKFKNGTDPHNCKLVFSAKLAEKDFEYVPPEFWPAYQNVLDDDKLQAFCLEQLYWMDSHKPLSYFAVIRQRRILRQIKDLVSEGNHVTETEPVIKDYLEFLYNYGEFEREKDGHDPTSWYIDEDGNHVN